MDLGSYSRRSSSTETGIKFQVVIAWNLARTHARMFTTEFYITMSYSIFSCILYILVSYLIIKNKRVFSGSYYNIILVDSAVNVFVFLTSITSFRLPRATSKDSVFAEILPQLPFLNFFGCMMCHLPYVQYLMVLSLIFNRFTAIVFHMKYNQIWDYLFIPLMLFNIFFPFLFTWQWFTDQYEALNWYLSITRIVTTTLSTIFMVTTIFFYKCKAKIRDQQVEVGLLIFSVISFLVQLFGTLAILSQYLDTAWKITEFLTIGQYVIQYTKDCTTFGSPYILLLCSPRLRSILKQMLLGTKSKNSTITPMYIRSGV